MGCERLLAALAGLSTPRDQRSQKFGDRVGESAVADRGLVAVDIADLAGPDLVQGRTPRPLRPSVPGEAQGVAVLLRTAVYSLRQCLGFITVFGLFDSLGDGLERVC
jgi:hypothetical protein